MWVKRYVLGTLFNCFISEKFSNYIEGGDNRRFSQIHHTGWIELEDEQIQINPAFIVPIVAKKLLCKKLQKRKNYFYQ